MKRSLVVAALFLALSTAVLGAAQVHSTHKTRARHALHQRAGKHPPPKLTKGGAHREGPLQVRPDGTVVPSGLTPRMLPVPEVLKKKAPPQG
jgi:hypothetical protein